MNTSGFYNKQGDYAKSAVYGPNYVLLAESRHTYTYPLYGWTWYDSAEEAQQMEGFDVSIVEAINYPFKSNINNLEQ